MSELEELIKENNKLIKKVISKLDSINNEIELIKDPTKKQNLGAEFRNTIFGICKAFGKDADYAKRWLANSTTRKLYVEAIESGTKTVDMVWAAKGMRKTADSDGMPQLMSVNKAISNAAYWSQEYSNKLIDERVGMW